MLLNNVNVGDKITYRDVNGNIQNAIVNTVTVHINHPDSPHREETRFVSVYCEDGTKDTLKNHQVILHRVSYDTMKDSFLKYLKSDELLPGKSVAALYLNRETAQYLSINDDSNVVHIPLQNGENRYFNIGFKDYRSFKVYIKDFSIFDKKEESTVSLFDFELSFRAKVNALLEHKNRETIWLNKKDYDQLRNELSYSDYLILDEERLNAGRYAVVNNHYNINVSAEVSPGTVYISDSDLKTVKSELNSGDHTHNVFYLDEISSIPAIKEKAYSSNLKEKSVKTSSVEPLASSKIEEAPEPNAKVTYEETAKAIYEEVKLTPLNATGTFSDNVSVILSTLDALKTKLQSIPSVTFPDLPPITLPIYDAAFFDPHHKILWNPIDAAKSIGKFIGLNPVDCLTDPSVFETKKKMKSESTICSKAFEPAMTGLNFIFANENDIKKEFPQQDLTYPVKYHNSYGATKTIISSPLIPQGFIYYARSDAPLIDSVFERQSAYLMSLSKGHEISIAETKSLFRAAQEEERKAKLEGVFEVTYNADLSNTEFAFKNALLAGTKLSLAIEEYCPSLNKEKDAVTIVNLKKLSADFGTLPQNRVKEFFNTYPKFCANFIELEIYCKEKVSSYEFCNKADKLLLENSTFIYAMQDLLRKEKLVKTSLEEEKVNEFEKFRKTLQSDTLAAPRDASALIACNEIEDLYVRSNKHPTFLKYLNEIRFYMDDKSKSLWAYEECLKQTVGFAKYFFQSITLPDKVPSPKPAAEKIKTDSKEDVQKVSVEKNMNTKTASVEGKTMTKSFMEDVTDTIDKAQYRVAQRQVVRRLRDALVLAVSQFGHDKAEVKLFEKCLKSQIGEGMLALFLGFAGSRVDLLSSNPKIARLLEESKVEGMAAIGDDVIERIASQIAPLVMGALTSSLDALPEVRIEVKEKPKKVRIRTKKVTVEDEEAEATNELLSSEEEKTSKRASVSR